MLPISFDPNIYKLTNPDLANMTTEQLIDHYKKHGENEGRTCSNICNRETLMSYIDTDNLQCLEIGPFDTPVITGNNVQYFDVLDKDGLIDRAIQINRLNNIENIPTINYVDNTGDLTIINKKFNIVLSCHSIEHQLDFIEHLRNVSNLLLDNGYYIVILPDKRFCFDHFIKETTIADIIEQHVNKKKFHSIKSVIEHRALICHNDPHRHWNNDHGNDRLCANSVISAIDEYNECIKQNKYIDVHSLQFTPKSFNHLIDLLYNMKYIDLHIHQIYPTLQNCLEFYVVLKKSI